MSEAQPREVEDEAEASDAPRYDDDELLALVRHERQRSIGFGDTDSAELTEARETAISYYKGDMINVASEHQVASLPNRSKAVDTVVADAVETVLPDVLEVFIGGDDVATFQATGPDDEKMAADESDYVRQVIFDKNPGFINVYTACKDALISRTGLFYWYPEDYEDTQTRATVQAEHAEALQAVAKAMGQELEPEEQDDGSVALNQTQKLVKVCVEAVPPEDFSVARDTKLPLKDTTYCCLRDRPRVQQLIERGVDPDVARSLKSYEDRNEQVERSRDEAGEHDKTLDGETGDLRVVEVRAHYIRLDMDGDGKTEIWRVLTDAEETVLIEKEEIGQIPFAALTPYINPHRFYGESVADKLIEVQKIKTALLRMLLDSGYFALNQRNYVAQGLANDFTIPDLLNNVPGQPVRGDQPGAVTPLAAGQLNFDSLAALEYAATMAESRSGIVRNAQGLNPDTLHDTAGGALALIAAAQKRVRLIARVFAETGIKDLFLGVHQMLRTSYGEGYARPKAKIGNAWQEIDPSSWPKRDEMAIDVGIGSAGREHDLLVATQRLSLTERAIEIPGAQALLDPSNVHNQLMAWERAAGSKDPDRYWSDPTTPEGQQRLQQMSQQPDPKMAEAQANIQLKQSESQADIELRRVQAQADLELRQSQAATDAQTDMARVQSDHTLKMEQMRQDFALKREQLQAELALERYRLEQELQIQREAAQHRAAAGYAGAMVDNVEPGGEPG